MLQGTIESFPLPDVMRFLSSTGKVGRLTATGHDGPIEVVVDGPTVLVRGPEMDDAAESVFDLLRVTSGPFVFDDEAPIPNGLNAFPAESVLARASQLAVEWERVSTLIPSAQHHMTLCEELPGESLSVSRDDWRLIRRLAAGGTASDFSSHLDVSVNAATRRMAGLVERGIAVVQEPIAAVVAAPIAQSAGDASSEEAQVASVEPEPTMAAVAAIDDEETVEPQIEPIGAVHAGLAAFFAQDEPSNGVPEPEFDVVAPTDEEASPDQSIGSVAEAAGGDADEPEQRALLYRFLSSVRS